MQKVPHLRPVIYGRHRRMEPPRRGPVMTEVLTIAAACIGILFFFAAIIWLGRRVSFRPPLEDPPPASWITKQRGDR